VDVLAQLSSALKERYALDREIGRGGMATVYLARDVRHNRNVAVKVLNPELGAVLGVERFLSEIQVTANLQHPNLLPLFDSGEAGGLLFYVMPYVEGESLRKRLMRVKQLPIDEAVHIATAIASALDYAHRHGVIHRDLKPENILLQEGQPVIADFGIALAVSNAGGSRVTQTGISLGTPQYMSPEQATGDRDIDGRTDIYSLGAMLYEMLAGEPPYVGNTAQAIIAKVITDKPRSLRLARDTVSPTIEMAVECALAKLPADRFATAQAFADALKGHGAATSRSIPIGSSAEMRVRLARRSPWRALAARVAGVATVVAIGVAIGFYMRGLGVRPSPTVRYDVRFGTGMSIAVGGGSPVAISRDGRYLAYTANGVDNTRHVYIRGADELQAREVPGSILGRAPFFSPDGQWIGFWAAGQVKKAPVSGGVAVAVADLANMSPMTWSPSNRLVMSDGKHLLRVASTGGTPERFASPDTVHGETALLNPVALPDGKHVLYSSLGMGGATGSRIGIASIADGSSRPLDLPGTFPLGLLDDQLIFTTAGGTVMAAPFDLKTLKITGAQVPLIDQVAAEVGNPLTYAAMSADGSLVYVTGLTRRQLVFATSDGANRPIMAEPQAFANPRLSPDAKRIAVTVGTPTRADVWVYDLPSGPFAKLTTEGANNDRPEWKDSRIVIFRSNRGGLNSMWSQPIDGSSGATLVFGQSDAKVDEGVLSPDGRYLLFQRDRLGLGELWYRAMQGDTTPHRVGNGAFGETGGRFSPDGKWVVYQSSEAGATQVYVRPFPALNARYQVSLNGGATPVWSRDGRRIFYVTERQLVAATIGSTQPFSIASRETVLGRTFSFSGTHADYDIVPDGKSFLVQRSPDQDLQVVVVLNWLAEVRARLRGTAR